MTALRHRVTSALRRRTGAGGPPPDPRLAAIATRPSVRTRRLGPKAWLVQTRTGRRRLRVLPVGTGNWLLEPRTRPAREVRPVGPRTLRTHLLLDTEAVRRDPRRFQQGMANVASAEHIAWMLRVLEVDCVLDVGANVGQYAMSLRAAGYTGRIVSFEPVASLAEQLRANAAADDDWLVVHSALGDEEGEAEINVVPGSMSSMLHSSDFGKQWAPVLQGMRPERITIRRLDRVLDEVTAGLDTPRVYLKMDTQGYDLQAFSGAGDRIKEIVGMQSEVACVPIYDGMPRLPQQIEVYEAAGFELTGMFPVTIDGASLRVIEFDAVMIRADELRAGA